MAVCMLSVGSNINSLKIAGYLQRAGEAHSSALSRLSSGMRLNKASDDPAGLAVSSSLQVRSRILGRARLNVSDGMSVMQIADGALEQISNLVSRMSELAEQAANGTFSARQRQSLTKEYSALDQEIRRITEATSFNGINLLTGERTKAEAQLLLQKDTTDLWSDCKDISGDGRYIAFTEAEYSGFHLVDTVSGEDRKVSVDHAMTVENIKLLANGDAVFSAVTGTYRDLYLFSQASGEMRKLTSSMNPTGLQQFALSADGSTVAFTSRTRYVDGGTLADGASVGVEALQTLNLTTGVFRRASAASAVQLSTNTIVLSADGSKAALISRSSPTGENPSSYRQMFYADFSASNPAVKQLTAANGTLLQVAWLGIAGVSNEGKVYISGPGTLAPTQIGSTPYLMEVDSSTLESKAFYSASSYVSAIGLSADCSQLYFVSSDDVDNQNPSGLSQIFRMDLSLGTVRQISSMPSFTPEQAIGTVLCSDDGSRAVFAVNAILEDEVTERDWIYTQDLTPESKALDFEAGLGAAGNIAVEVSAVMSSVRGLGSYTLGNQFIAGQALDRMRSNLESLSAARGIIGAGMSRLAVAESLVASQRDEVTGADSRIKDADIAQESSSALASSILQQVGASLLAQANQAPALVLNLIR